MPRAWRWPTTTSTSSRCTCWRRSSTSRTVPGRALLERAGVRVPALKSAVDSRLKRLPQVSGTGGEVQVGRELVNLLNLSEKEATRRGDQFIASEMFLLALTEDEGRKAGHAGRLAA